MVTALDTNVLVTLLKADKSEDVTTARTALEKAGEAGKLIVSPAVYSELYAAPRMTEGFLDGFLKTTHISTEWRHPQTVWRSAATAYKGYADRRRNDPTDDGPRRILADFLIGAHALHYADALLTFDRGVYRAAFPELTVRVLEAV